MRVHNLYSVIYNELVFDLLKKRFGEGEAVVFARSSTVGGQRFPVVSTTPVSWRVKELIMTPIHQALGGRLRVNV